MSFSHPSHARLSQQARPITNQSIRPKRTTNKETQHRNRRTDTLTVPLLSPRRFSNNYTDARFYKIDVDEVPEVAQEQSVRAMPTFLLYKDGKQVGEVVGANPAALEAAIKTHA